MAKSAKGNKSRNANSTTCRGKNNARKPRKNFRRQDEQEETKSPATSSLNDVAWYSRNPALLVAAGQFPYPYRPGMDIDLASEGTPKSQGFRLPGVFKIGWVPSFGNSSESTDPASIAGKEFYGRVRAAYSGALDADAPDFMVYVGGLDSIFSYIGWLKRLYRTISTYSPDNLDLPEALIAAYGFEYNFKAKMTDIRLNKVKLWQGINELILMTRKFKCPAVMDLFNRHYWLSDNIYADAPSTRAQLFVFNLDAVYKTQQVTEAGTGSEQVQGLAMTAIPTEKASGDQSLVDTLINFGFDLIRAFDEWDSSYTISGYLQRAFDGTPSFVVAELMQDEQITAQYVPEVLSQIENARCVFPAGRSMDYNVRRALYPAMIVTQNTLTNAVVSNVNFTIDDEINSTNAIDVATILSALPNGVAPCLNLHNDAPTVADTVVASRLHCVTKNKVTKDTKYHFAVEVIAGTELVVELSVMKPDANGWFGDSVQQLYASNLPVAGSSDRLVQAPNDLVEQFDSHPIVYSAYYPVGQSGVSVYPHADIYNLTKITFEMIANLHKICFYSELNSFAI